MELGRTANMQCPHGITKKRTLPGKDHKNKLFLNLIPQTIKPTPVTYAVRKIIPSPIKEIFIPFPGHL